MILVHFIACGITGLTEFILGKGERSVAFKSGWDEGFSAGVNEAYERINRNNRWHQVFDLNADYVDDNIDVRLVYGQTRTVALVLKDAKPPYVSHYDADGLDRMIAFLQQLRQHPHFKDAAA